MRTGRLETVVTSGLRSSYIPSLIQEKKASRVSTWDAQPVALPQVPPQNFNKNGYFKIQLRRSVMPTEHASSAVLAPELVSPFELWKYKSREI